MKIFISGMAIALCVGMVGCNPSSNPESQAPGGPVAEQAPTSTPSTPTPQATATASQPAVGTVKSIVQGDIMCYVTLVDENGVEQEIGASFEICDQQEKFINQKVRLSYEIASVNDCQSNEPCGKSRDVSLATKMEVIEGS